MKLKELKELAEKAWEGCHGCDENDKNFFINGFITGYNRLKPDLISDEEALKLAKEMKKQPMKFVPDEISDEEIEKAWISYQRECLEKFEKDTTIAGYAITNKEKFAKWYREQLKQRQ